MFRGLPPGSPGTLTWKAQQVGIDPYNLALAAAGAPGHEGRQARFYLAFVGHQRMRRMALAAAQQPRMPTA